MSAVPSPEVRRVRASRRLLVLVGLLVVAAGAAVGVWWWLRPPQVPEIPVEGFDPDVAAAIKSARAEVVQQPRSAATWAILAEILLANEVAEEQCLVCLRELERLDPKQPRWPYYCAGILLNQGKRDQALPKLQRAVELCEAAGETNPAPRLVLAETLLTLDRADAAEALFRQTLAHDAHHLRAHFGLGQLAHARQDWKACRAHLEACVGSDQARRKAAIQLAAVCQRLGDTAAAAKYNDIATRAPKDRDWVDPFISDYLRHAQTNRRRYRLVEQLEAAGRFPEAAKVLRLMVEKAPQDDLVYITLGRILPQMGDFESAEYFLKKARELAPDKLQPHYLLSLVLLEKGKRAWFADKPDKAEARQFFEESIACGRKALEIRPDVGFAHMAMGLSLKYLGRRGEALSALRQAVKCSPEYADNHYHLGLALKEEGDITGARHHLQEAGRLAPNDPRPKVALEKLPS